MARGNAGKSQPTAADQRKLGYLQIRDRFLAERPEGDKYVEWLIEVGRYVHHCWLAEEEKREPGKELNETAVWNEWDGCTEGSFRDLRADGVIRLQGYGARRLWADIGAWLKERSLDKLLGVVLWIAQAMIAGFFGGIGLILLGLLVAAVEPRIVRSLRAAVDDALPAATSPLCPPGHTKATDPTHC